jgi:hypothetical protein
VEQTVGMSVVNILFQPAGINLYGIISFDLLFDCLQAFGIGPEVGSWLRRQLFAVVAAPFLASQDSLDNFIGLVQYSSISYYFGSLLVERELF